MIHSLICEIQWKTDTHTGLLFLLIIISLLYFFVTSVYVINNFSICDFFCWLLFQNAEEMVFFSVCFVFASSNEIQKSNKCTQNQIENRNDTLNSRWIVIVSNWLVRFEMHMQIHRTIPNNNATPKEKTHTKKIVSYQNTTTASRLYCCFLADSMCLAVLYAHRELLYGMYMACILEDTEKKHDTPNFSSTGPHFHVNSLRSYKINWIKIQTCTQQAVQSKSVRCRSCTRSTHIVYTEQTESGRMPER